MPHQFVEARLINRQTAGLQHLYFFRVVVNAHHLMADLGVRAADIGLPGAGPRAVAQVRALAREIVDQKLPINMNCAARTVIADVEPIVRLSGEVGVPIEAATDFTLYVRDPDGHLVEFTQLQ